MRQTEREALGLGPCAQCGTWVHVRTMTTAPAGALCETCAAALELATARAIVAKADRHEHEQRRMLDFIENEGRHLVAGPKR